MDSKFVSYQSAHVEVQKCVGEFRNFDLSRFYGNLENMNRQNLQTQTLRDHYSGMELNIKIRRHTFILSRVLSDMKYILSTCMPWTHIDSHVDSEIDSEVISFV